MYALHQPVLVHHAIAERLVRVARIVKAAFNSVCYLQNPQNLSNALMRSVRSLNVNIICNCNRNNCSNNSSFNNSSCNNTSIKSFNQSKRSLIFIKFITRTQDERRWTALHSMFVAINFFSIQFLVSKNMENVSYLLIFNIFKTFPFQFSRHCRIN